MLELRPSCEHCDTRLPPSSPAARICSFECTFCATCVEQLLSGVCPNCGGGFVPRPIRPELPWKGSIPVEQYPPTTTITRHAVNLMAHEALVAARDGAPS